MRTLFCVSWAKGMRCLRSNQSINRQRQRIPVPRLTKPARMGRAAGYICGLFAIGSSGLHRLNVQRHSTARNAVLIPVSQGTEVIIVTEYVPF